MSSSIEEPSSIFSIYHTTLQFSCLQVHSHLRFTIREFRMKSYTKVKEELIRQNIFCWAIHEIHMNLFYCLPNRNQLKALAFSSHKKLCMDDNRGNSLVETKIPLLFMLGKKKTTKWWRLVENLWHLKSEKQQKAINNTLS